MSLSRVAALDGRERTRAGSTVSQRRMSFNPVAEWGQKPSDEAPEDFIAKFANEDVSSGRMKLQIGIAMIQCLFAAGPIFGYAAIKPVLVHEGVYVDKCTQQEIDTGITPCYGQEIRLNLMFTVAAVATNISALPIGVILDRYGPRACAVIGSVFIAIGTLLFAFGKKMSPEFEGYIPGYFFLALGGPFVHISSFHLSNCFPANSSLILALFTGGFDSSSALYFFFRLIYEATGGSFNVESFFLVYLVVPVFIFLAQITVMPVRSYKSVGEVITQAEDELNREEDQDSPVDTPTRQTRRESAMSEINLLLKTADPQKEEREDEKNQISGVWGALHGYSAWEQIKTFWFWLITAFAVVQMLRINYFVATVRPQYLYILGSESAAEAVNNFFDIALPLGGVISIPFVGALLDNTSTLFALTGLVIAATIIGILGLLPYFWAAILNVCLFVIFRPFFYTTVSDYAAKVFGFVTFGKVYGLVICLAGLFNLLESPLDAARYELFKRDPLPINFVLMVVAAIFGVALLTFVYIASKKLKRSRLEEEAEAGRNESESLIQSTTWTSGYGT